ncbi:MAG: hypothetical protein AAFY48_15330 [Bacteroidota bacterium]
MMPNGYTSAQRRFILREAELFEFEDVRRFYEENQDPLVAERPSEVIRAALHDGSIIIAIDTQEDDDRKRIFGASAAYTRVVNLPTGGRAVLKEAGSSLIKKSHRGYGLHKVFHWLRSLHEHILDKGGFEEYFSAVRAPNPISERSLIRTGFEPWESAPPHLMELKQSALPDDSDATIEIFRLPLEALQTHAKELLAFELEHVASKNGNGDTDAVEVYLAVQILERYRPVVQAIADLGPKLGLA